MTYKLEDIISKSGDSELVDYSFCDGLLKVTLRLYEDDELINFSILTSTVFGSSNVTNGSYHSTCYMNLICLHDVLKTENGYFLPEPDFKSLMKHERECINLAYGKNQKSVNHLLQFRGGSVLLACLVGEPEDVVITIED